MKLTPTRDPIWTILLIVLLFRIAYGFFLLPPVIVAADSPSYLGPSQTAFVDLLYGKPDLIRTPGYPCFSP